MKNFVQDGDTLDVTLPYDALSGVGVKVGDIFGVSVKDGVNGALEHPIKTTGVFDLKYGVAAVVNVGAKVYWDDAAKNVTGTAAANLLIGYAVKAAANADPTIRVRLIPAA